MFCIHLHTRERAHSHCFAAPGMMPTLSQLVDSIHRAGLELTWKKEEGVVKGKGELEPSLLQTKEIKKKKKRYNIALTASDGRKLETRDQSANG